MIESKTVSEALNENEQGLDNKDFIIDYLTKALTQLFTNMNSSQIEAAHRKEGGDFSGSNFPSLTWISSLCCISLDFCTMPVPGLWDQRS